MKQPVRIDIKPLSVNDAWNTFCTRCRSAKVVRRTKSVNYKKFEKAVMLMLPREIDLPMGRLRADFVWGVSNSGSDYDNPIKPFQDILQKKYGFNDSRIFVGNQEKKLVKKGQEFIEFQITGIENILEL